MICGLKEKIRSWFVKKDVKIKTVAANFFRFFRIDNNLLDHFNAMCYFYRTNAYEGVNDEASDFGNMLLKKITAIKTILFVEFYDKNIQKELQSEIENSKGIIKTMITDPKIKDKFNEVRFINRKIDDKN